MMPDLPFFPRTAILRGRGPGSGRQSRRTAAEREAFITMTIQYAPKGVCSRSFEIEVDGGVIQSVQVVGGCSGNLQGLSSLLKGMEVEEAIRRMEGIRCGGKATSCPDQIAQALKTAL